MTPPTLHADTIFLIVAALTELILVVGGAYMYFRWMRQKRICEQLLQEKEVIFGFVHDVGEVFAEAEHIEPDLLLKRVLYYALRTTKAAAGATYLFEPSGDQLRARAVSGIFPPLTQEVKVSVDRAVSKAKHIETLVRTALIRRGDGLVGRVADIGTPLLIADADCDVRVPKHDLDFLHIQSILLVPMRFHHNTLGVLAVVNRVDGTMFDQTDLNLLQALADQASAAVYYAGLRDTLDEKKRIDHDLSLARQIQSSLLPEKLPQVAGLEVAAFNQPAKQIGGDYYDLVRVDDNHLGIAIADVSGKSIGGALLMSVCRSVLRAQAPGNHSPADVLKSINRVMNPDIAEDMFVTMLYMVLDLSTLKLTVARCGHEKPVLLSADGLVEELSSSGTAIGMTDIDTFESILDEKVVDLKHGDVLVTYTDGITEAMNERGEEWGIDSLLEACNLASEEGAHSLLNNVRQRVERFAGEQPQYDDMTLLAIRVNS